jgi:hypothetical protein
MDNEIEDYAKVTINRRFIGGDDEGVISINIRDNASRQTVVDLNVSLKDFAECITGLSEVKAEYRKLISDATNLRKKCITTVCEIDLPEDISFNSNAKQVEIEALITQYILNKREEDGVGYVIHSNGMKSKQMTNKHRFSIRHWEEL